MNPKVSGQPGASGSPAQAPAGLKSGQGVNVSATLRLALFNAWNSDFPLDRYFKVIRITVEGVWEEQQVSRHVRETRLKKWRVEIQGEVREYPPMRWEELVKVIASNGIIIHEEALRTLIVAMPLQAIEDFMRDWQRYEKEKEEMRKKIHEELLMRAYQELEAYIKGERFWSFSHHDGKLWVSRFLVSSVLYVDEKEEEVKFRGFPIRNAKVITTQKGTRVIVPFTGFTVVRIEAPYIHRAASVITSIVPECEVFRFKLWNSPKGRCGSREVVYLNVPVSIKKLRVTINESIYEIDVESGQQRWLGHAPPEELAEV